MTAIRIDQLSEPERLLWSYGVTQPEHIDLEAIAADRGAAVLYRPLDGCEARLVAFGERATISINSKSRFERRRFSLGHELAHWLRDRRTGSYLCTQENISPQNAEARSVEAKANAFASQMLMPNYLVDPWLADRKVNLDTANQLGTAFRTSLTASAIKLVKRADVPSCVLCHNQRGLVWSRKSPSLTDSVYVPPELNHETEAFAMVFEAGERISRPRTEPADRWMSSATLRGAMVESQTVRLAEGVVLTIVSLKQPARSALPHVASKSPR